MRFAASLLGALCLCGCESVFNTNLNEGQVRMGSVPFAAARGAAPAEDADTFSPAVFFQTDQTPSATNGLFEEKDVFQITLVSAHICGFREAGGLSNRISGSNRGARICDGRSSSGTGTRGEVAILGEFAFDSKEADNTGGERLIFFSDDVRESGQLLNFLNRRIYGPAPYLDASSTLTLTVIELDEEESESQSKLLTELANQGAKFASPVAGAALSVLSQVGAAFIASNEDDREFFFQKGFDPANKDSLIHRSPLREGYLLAMRKERRSDFDHFRGIRLCREQGYVIGPDQTCANGEYYREDTWMLLRVSKERSSVATAVMAETLAEVLEARRPARTSADFAAIGDAIKALLPDDNGSAQN